MKGQKFLKVTGILMIIGAALSILFGVIIVIALAVISNVLEVIGGGKFNVLSFVIGLIVPGLYIYGAFLNHKENAR